MNERSSTNVRAGRIFRSSSAFWLLLVLCWTLGWCRWVYAQIEHYAGQDQAAPADAIGVFGAAEYDGRPSPVYRARLDHAQALYQPRHRAADHHARRRRRRPVLRGWRGARVPDGYAGVPESSIIAETESRKHGRNRPAGIAVIARANGFQRLVL